MSNSTAVAVQPAVVTIVGGGGVGATAVATVINGVVVAITPTAVGAGYGGGTAVNITGTGAGATATANIVGGAITSYTVNSGGLGYFGVPLFQVPLHMKGKIDAIIADNEGSSGQIQFTIDDSFTQDISATNNTPTPRYAEPSTFSVPQTQTVVLKKEDLEGVSLLGLVFLEASVSDIGARVNVQWHLE